VIGAAVLAVVAMTLGVAGFTVIRGSAFDDIVAAGERTEEAGTARVAVTTVVDAGVGRAKQRIDSVGLVDFGAGATQFEVRVGSPQASGELPVGDVPLLVTDDGTDTFVRYVSWSADRPWVRLTPDEVSTGGSESTGGGADGLAALLRALRSGVTEVEEIGGEVVRGDDTTHLRATVDLTRAVAAASKEDREELDRLTEIQSRDELVLDVWTDGERVRRLSYTLDLTRPPDGSADPAAEPAGEPSPPSPSAEAPASGAELPGMGPGATFQVVLEYFDFGVPFVVQVPPDVEEATGGPPTAPSAEPSPSASTDR
jgi:hypothetical protein